MKLSLSLVPLLIATASVASVSLAQTVWTVDVDPLAGADFLDIQSGIDAATVGDTLLVGPGIYGQFTLTKGLAIIGRGQNGGANGTTIFGHGRVQALPPDELAVLADLNLDSRFTVLFSRGRVVIDQCTGSLDSVRSADVRFRACTGWITMNSTGGWLEHAECSGSMRVTDWWSTQVPPAQVLVTNPRLVGRDAWGYISCWGPAPFYSAPGLDAERADIIIAGHSASYITGGAGYPWTCYHLYGSAGVALEDGSLRLSGVNVSSRDHSIADLALGQSVQFTAPSTVDPTLRVQGIPYAGASLTITVDGADGDEARLELGTGPALTASGTSAVPRLVTPGRVVPMGQIPITGSLDFTARIPAGAIPGTVFWLQGWTVTPSGEGRRTNSLPLVVRG